MAGRSTKQRRRADSEEDRRRLSELDEMAERLAHALELTTADETELAFLETVGGRAVSGHRRPEGSPVRRTVLIRVREGGRRGAYRIGSGRASEILNGIRLAIAASRTSEPMPHSGPWTQHPEESGDAADRPAGEPAPEDLWDRRVAALEPFEARELLRDLLADGADREERLALEWRAFRVVVRTSSGIDRRAEATSVSLEARSAAASRVGRSGKWDRAGWAAGAGRSLTRLDAVGVLDRARQRSATADLLPPDGAAGPPERASGSPAAEQPILFSPEAAASLVALLVRKAFTASAFGSERSPLAGLLGEHVFAPEIDLVDDGLDPSGLPFPFDLLGRPRERIQLVSAGVPRTPAVDERLGARLQRRPTPHALGPADARPIHPFLLPRHSAADVLATAEGGLWIAGLEDLECFDPGRIAVRARSIGARRVRGGALAEPVPPVIWEDSLLRLFSKVRALGGEAVVLAEDGGMGGVSAPMICAAGAERLEPAGR